MSNIDGDKPLQGYRIALTRECDTHEIREAGADTVCFPVVLYDRGAFVEWWNNESERAYEDRLQLVAMKSFNSTAISWIKWLEEEEWYSSQGEKPTRVRLTSFHNLNRTIWGREALKDDWGDIIDRLGQSIPNDECIAAEISRMSSSTKMSSPIQNESSSGITGNM
jgi:hypothetical protein